ncbi:bifunctional 1-(5-phosphoribosyl)-5-((5-phosphoribosylamino)methylideneamino)imidazole-4-carboxamide isomerase/phosphoribosylanthranilate isomerase PriA [Streptomyces roseoverticillatus]|uniref:HisA/HisF-related TIM barrel protein n=1 Tax=Streptomyces roseoverticillatus TaxID=66429 RepID=UPI001F297CDD|nr:HisA/HisF-related TIM barrel protein [Streptomyces roseoverticillatus]MCF3102302.1 bifunctional 1-(5-phosphoribosyl)-5-((5-phosphoribosylamino)methylideneamino)imidazole-4-carboxamide isomerase/phosphoribosylanthranilate isomerase PriA [Streptomyces roseoverticillatus]
MSFTVFPSIHIERGRVVHLVQDQAVAEEIRTDPLKVALEFQSQGARWVHLVAVGEESHEDDFATVERIVGSLGINVQTLFRSVADDDSLECALATGCARLNLGRAALADMEWCLKVIADHGDRLGVSTPVRLTAQGPRVATIGGRDVGDLWEVLGRLEGAGCARCLVTDIGTEGTLSGPNLPLFEEVCARTGMPVLAAGGIRDLDDLRSVADLADQGVAGAVIGRALYTGALSLPQALAL